MAASPPFSIREKRNEDKRHNSEKKNAMSLYRDLSATGSKTSPVKHQPLPPRALRSYVRRPCKFNRQAFVLCKGPMCRYRVAPSQKGSLELVQARSVSTKNMRRRVVSTSQKSARRYASQNQPGRSQAEIPPWAQLDQ